MEARSKDNAADQLRDKAAEIKEDIRELGSLSKDVAAEKLDQWYKEGRDKAIKLEKGFENRIREHPLQSVVIAAGVGFLAGFLISRRR